MKRIAILAPYVGTIDRGAETFVKELTTALKDEFKIDVYSLNNDGSIKDNIVCVDVNETLLFSVYKKIYMRNRCFRFVIDRFYHIIPDVLFQRKFSKECFKLIYKKEYDLLFPNNGIWGAYYARKYRRRNGVPFIYTGHGGIGRGEKIIIKHEPDAYVSLTCRQKVWADGIASEKTRSLVIHNGVNVNDFKLNNKKRDSIRIILSVGALTSFKRHKLTIDAVSRVKKAYLVILGTGEEYDSLIRLADSKIPGRYCIKSVPYNEMGDYYAKADLFCLPSYNEPFGIVYLEALASNLPIVAPDDSIRREIVAEAGLYCDVTDANQYAECINKALNMDWRDIPMKRAEKFDWSIISSEYKRLFEDTIDDMKGNLSIKNNENT